MTTTTKFRQVAEKGSRERYAVAELLDLNRTDRMDASDAPLYNIGVVTRITGVSKATLRAWERRYGFPDSERTSGGHRLYSERDIVRLRWVKNRIDQGMQTAQAIRALHHQEQSGRLQEAEQPEAVVIEAPLEIELSDTVNPLAMIYQRRLMEAFLARDIPQAEQILGEGLASMSPEGLMLDVISPTIGHIGHAWENDKISVAVEHLATNFLRHRLMMWMLSSPPPMSVAPIVLSCAPGEWHEMGLLIMGALLRRRQWPIAYLGQSMPLPDLAKFIQDIKPSLVILVAMTEETARAMQDWPQHLPLAAKTGKPTITYGGRVFVEHPEMRLQVPGLYLGDNLREGLMTIESLLKGV